MGDPKSLSANLFVEAQEGPSSTLAASRETADAGAASDKQQAPSIKLDSRENVGYSFVIALGTVALFKTSTVHNKEGERHMAQSYPIWIKVSGDNYKTNKSFGSRDSVTMDIKVGSSARNSNDLARVSIQMREDAAGSRTFALALDGLVMRSAVMTKDKKFWHRDPEAA